jgi:ribosomal protein S27E
MWSSVAASVAKVATKIKKEDHALGLGLFKLYKQNNFTADQTLFEHHLTDVDCLSCSKFTSRE